jgi:hypothetical protein
MKDEDLDFGDECMGTKDVFLSDDEFIHLQRLNKASDIVPLGPLDPLKMLDPEVPNLIQGLSLNSKGGRSHINFK